MDPAFQLIIQLVVLFFVIFDPFVSLAVFVVATGKMEKRERNKTAALAVFVAGAISAVVLFFGPSVLTFLSTTLDDFRVAGGIILGLLGIKMVWGHSNGDAIKDNSAKAVAAIIGTPLLTGPAAITAIMISVNDYGHAVTGAAVALVLGITAIMLYQASAIHRALGQTTLQVMSTILGLITIAWGVKFIRVGLGI
jgi:multiple antibiotic resistance protein